MNLLILSLLVLTLFLFVTLIMAEIIVSSHGDSSASYKLYAARDKLIDAVVFKGVSRHNPHVEALYENINSILVHSQILSGPDRWPIAVEAGKYFGENPEVEGKKLNPMPKDTCPPEALEPVLEATSEALDYLLRNHFGFYLQFEHEARAARRRQKEKARELREMMRAGYQLCHA